MIHTAFFIQAIRPETDYTRLEETGNPGIGGTEFEILLIAQSLACRYPDFRISLITPEKLRLNPAVRQMVTGDAPLSADALRRLCIQESVSVLVMESRVDSEYLEAFRHDAVRLILWAHCFTSRKRIHEIERNPAVRQLVCVGHEQLEMLRDHDVFSKATFIYNCVPVPAYLPQLVRKHPFHDREPVVVYLGSLHYMKGFHLLAAAWKRIRSAVPDATLHVLGGSSSGTLGAYRIASPKYEELFIKHLLDADGRLMDSVFFHGNSGVEKWEVLCRARVGVPNPSGRSETFCLSLVEMLLSGARVTTIASPAARDVSPFPEDLYQKPQALADSVIELLLAGKAPDYETTVQLLTTRFGPGTVLARWRECLSAVAEDKPVFPQEKPVVCHPDFQKRLRCINAKLRRHLPFLPAIGTAFQKC